MNICMFTNTYLPHVGGVARSVDAFAMDLRRMGHRVLVIAPQFQKVTTPETWTVRLAAIQHFNGSDFAVRIPLPFVVERQIEAFAPDIIHSHHPFLLGDTALRVARQKRLPLVFTHHTLYENYIHYVPIDSDRLGQFVINLATLYANFCDAVVAPSRSIARLIRSRGVHTPIAEISSGVDIDAFGRGRGGLFRSRYHIPPDGIVIGHLGRLAAEKNLSFLARAVKLFLSDNPRAYFLVVGDGTCKEEIISHFAQTPLSHRLIMAGQQTGQSLADAYRAMDLFVFTSLSETQGLVLAEAMAAGLSVIALDGYGVRDIVVDGRNGRLLPATVSAGEFAAAIQATIADPMLMGRLRNEAIATAERHSRRVCARKLADLYSEILAGGCPERENSTELGALDSLVSRIKLEWTLLSGKIKSVVETSPSEPTDAVDANATAPPEAKFNP